MIPHELTQYLATIVNEDDYNITQVAGNIIHILEEARAPKPMPPKEKARW